MQACALREQLILQWYYPKMHKLTVSYVPTRKKRTDLNPATELAIKWAVATDPFFFKIVV
jgi:hypothetical protein